jgi:hypothetical protein
MSESEKILQHLTEKQKKIIKEGANPGAIILFNIKGMIEILRDHEPFEFIDMGYEDIEQLKKKGLLSPLRTMNKSHILQGEEYELSDIGKKVAALLHDQKIS